MPVAFVKTALVSSSAFLSEAAANTVMYSCATSGAGAVASAHTRPKKAKNLANMAVLLRREIARVTQIRLEFGTAGPIACGARTGPRNSVTLASLADRGKVRPGSAGSDG